MYPLPGPGRIGFFDTTETGKVVLQARAAMEKAGEKQPIWFYMAPGDR